MLRPITPFLEYAVSYDYISKVLCINKSNAEMKCNGKCYVSKKLSQQKNDFKLLQISDKEYPIGFVELLNLHCLVPSYLKSKSLSFYQQEYSYLSDYSIFHPPKINISF